MRISSSPLIEIKKENTVNDIDLNQYNIYSTLLRLIRERMRLRASGVMPK